ncbi:hypothetical protein [Quatrionicoccus australiensis]|uniref:hypothetical protein n=1 Tax=Quatrionicoccus australiensis TaxID=138118 RepID=UPI001CF825EE|nr:hypothetical protein [Quatrionicoccus australiensis]UCV16987.1 hypothetical protein KI612_10090 [Quatrionicoccus australiensis]
MKWKLAALTCAYFVAGSALAGGSIAEKGAFYTAVTAVSPSDAAYSFLLEQYLEMKCGKPQSIAHIKNLSEQDGASLFVILALKAGDTAKARDIIRALPCEGASR